MVKKSGIKNINNEFVLLEPFLKTKSQDYLKRDYNKKRVICQQISNIDIQKRLNFVFCEERDILANSCNYFSMDDKMFLRNLVVLMNSYLLNWRFKITSGNNHINNYELDELPLLDVGNLRDLPDDELKRNIIISKLYGLNKKEIAYILTDFFNIKEINQKVNELENENI